MRRVDEWSHNPCIREGGQNPAYRPSGFLPSAEQVSVTTIVILNLFQDNAQPSRDILKQVQDDDGRSNHDIASDRFLPLSLRPRQLYMPAILWWKARHGTFLRGEGQCRSSIVPRT
jgi:hypothetical protein